MKKYLFIQSSAVCLALCFITFQAYAIEKSIPPPTENALPPVSHDDITKRAIRDQVKVLRQERYDKMPYLDRGFIRSSITSEKIRQKKLFASGSKKTLKDLVARAILVHTPAQAARERIALARRRIMVAVRAMFPEANVEFEHKHGGLSGSSGFNSRRYKLTLRQPLFRGGILWNTLLQENQGLQSAEKEYEKVISDLINDVSASYFEYQRATQVLIDQQKAIEEMRRFAEISEQKYKEQLVSEIEHLNVQSLFSQMEYDGETSKQELELAKLDLQQFLDLSLQDNLQVSDLYEAEDLISNKGVAIQGQDATQPPVSQRTYDFKENINIPNLGALVDLAYDHRAELEVESSKLQSARLEERVRWGDFVPHADLTVELGNLGEAFNVDSLDPKLRKEFRLMLEITWNAGGNKINYNFENNQTAPTVSQFQGGTGTRTMRNSLSIGLLDGLQSFAEVKEAEVAKLDQIAELEKAEKQVIQDVKQAYFDYQKALIQMQSTIKRVDYRRRLTLLSQHRLENNEVQISEYLQAESDLLREKVELHKAMKDYFTAKAKMNRAVGMQELLPVEEKYGRK